MTIQDIIGYASLKIMLMSNELFIVKKIEVSIENKIKVLWSDEEGEYD